MNWERIREPPERQLQIYEGACTSTLVGNIRPKTCFEFGVQSRGLRKACGFDARGFAFRPGFTLSAKDKHMSRGRVICSAWDSRKFLSSSLPLSGLTWALQWRTPTHFRGWFVQLRFQQPLLSLFGAPPRLTRLRALFALAQNYSTKKRKNGDDR